MQCNKWVLLLEHAVAGLARTMLLLDLPIAHLVLENSGEMQDPPPCNLTASMETVDANSSYMLKQCSNGYHGPACSLCIRNSTHSFGRTGTAKCQQCKSKGKIIMLYAASTTLVLLFLCYTVHTTLVENAQDPALAGGVDTVKVSDLLRVIFSNLSQWQQSACACS